MVRLVYDTRKLAAGFLFSVYRIIFAADNLMELLKNTSLILKSIHYTHNGFVALLGFVKAKAPTDCDQIIGFFIDFIESDSPAICGFITIKNSFVSSTSAISLPQILSGPPL